MKTQVLVTDGKQRCFFSQYFPDQEENEIEKDTAKEASEKSGISLILLPAFFFSNSYLLLNFYSSTFHGG